jgi:hypothetical protein
MNLALSIRTKSSLVKICEAQASLFPVPTTGVSQLLTLACQEAQDAQFVPDRRLNLHERLDSLKKMKRQKFRSDW